MQSADLSNRFAFHPAAAERADTHEQVRDACASLAHRLNELVPEGREKSLAITSLEQTMMWANAGIARADA